jgi:glycerophosphoryl diester phosphodiesterase
MIFISHRGNLSGKNPEMENTPEYISKALELGYDVEIDVWYHDDAFYLGHDEPDTECPLWLLNNEKIWVHAKNLPAIQKCIEASTPNFFWHQNDDYTLTNLGLIWTYPGKDLTNKSIAVLPETSEYSLELLSSAYGICSDEIEKYRMSL